MAEYRLAPAALADLEDIWAHTYQRHGLDQANSYVDELTQSFALLADMPGIAAACDHIKVGVRYLHLRRHVIYIRPVDDGIIVLRVLHERMLPSRHVT